MQIAIHWSAFPVVGLPTRRARRSCSSVASGISEKSSWRSGRGLFEVRFGIPERNFPRPMIFRFFGLVLTLVAVAMSDCITPFRPSKIYFE